MMRILLVDDEPLALERLEVAIAAIPDTHIVGTASDGIEAREKIAALRPDLAILDIQMPGLSGMEVAQSLEERADRAAERPDIVFVTAFNRFAIEAFGVEATDYLLKPVSFDRLQIAIERVRRRRALMGADRRAAALAETVAALREESPEEPVPGDYADGIWVPGRQGSVRVPVATIDGIEAARDYSLLNTPTKSYILRAKMNDLEQRLDPRLMIRIHRSHIVRIDAVVGTERPGKGVLRLVMNDGANLQVGPNYQDRVVAALGL